MKERPMTMSQFERLHGVHFCTNHTGKMTGICSLSTSPLCNPFCRARAKREGTICAHCYSCRMMKMYGALDAALRRNSEVLTARVIPVEEMPFVNAAVFRLESFGDLANAVQARNYLNLCLRNPRTTFALWTKNPAILARVFKRTAKPKNLVVIVSSPNLDERAKVAWDFVDKVFTVYSSEEKARVDGAAINCGARSCALCQRCYRRGGARFVNELLK